MSDIAVEDVAPEPANEIDDPVDLEPVEPTQPEPAWAPPQDAWETARAFIQRRIAEEIAPLQVQADWEWDNVVGEDGRTYAQRDAMARANFDAATPDLSEEQREQALARKNEIYRHALVEYGPDPNLEWEAALLAAREVKALDEADTFRTGMLETAARSIGLDGLDVERAKRDTVAEYKRLERERPNLGNINLGLAAVAAVAKQDGRDRDVSLSNVWGLASSLVRDLEPPAPQGTQHDYTQGGSVRARFFGKNADLKEPR